MSKSRVPSSRRKTGRKKLSSSKNKTKSSTTIPQSKNLHRFIGISLSGGKADKACVAVIEYFPEHKKIFLARMYEKIKSEDFISADHKIHEIISQYHSDIDLLAYDVPLSLPKCITCKLKCPGFESCAEPEIEWFRNFYAEINKHKKPKRMFTPYTQRCVEGYIGHSLEESFDIQHALGSNMAPLAARALFIQRRLHVPSIETYPKLTVWRLGLELKVAKSHLRFHRHVVGGDESRSVFLHQLAERRQVFFYQQDLKIMVENNHAFEAFIAAYTAYLKSIGETEPRPAGFPKSESWIHFPKAK